MLSVFHDDVDATPVANFMNKPNYRVIEVQLVCGWVLEVWLFVVSILQMWTVADH